MFRLVMYDTNGKIMYKTSWKSLRKRISVLKDYIKGFENRIEIEYKSVK